MPESRWKDPDPSSLRRITDSIHNLKRFTQSDTKEWSCFNPSIGYSPKRGYAIAFRSSNYVILPHGELYVTNGGKIRNKVWFAETDETFAIKNLREITTPESVLPMTRGMEDPRLFWRGGAWHFTSTMMEAHTPVARLAVCRMNDAATEVESIEVHPGVRPEKIEKNWMVPDLKDSKNFEFIYGPNSFVKDRKVVTYMTGRSGLSGLRGNSHLLEQKDGTYLAIMHKLWMSKKQFQSTRTFSNMDWVEKTYSHYFVRLDRFGAVTEISDPWILVKPGIEFVAGMVEMNGNLVISFGREDVSSHIAVVPKASALGMLHPIGG